MDWFEQQMGLYNPITEEIYEKITYKRVWSGELMTVGDTVLYAFVFDPKDNQLKLMSLLDREIPSIISLFDLVGVKNKIIPVLKYKTDAKQRTFKEDIQTD